EVRRRAFGRRSAAARQRSHAGDRRCAGHNHPRRSVQGHVRLHTERQTVRAQRGHARRSARTAPDRLRRHPGLPRRIRSIAPEQRSFAGSRAGALGLAEPLTAEVLGELLGLLAHDLRNPLSALHSNVGYLGSLSERYDDDAKEAIADALLSCDSLRTVIDSVEILSHVLTGTTGF